jgi:hypothetical protein
MERTYIHNPGFEQAVLWTCVNRLFGKLRAFPSGFPCSSSGQTNDVGVGSRGKDNNILRSKRLFSSQQQLCSAATAGSAAAAADSCSHSGQKTKLIWRTGRRGPVSSLLYLAAAAAPVLTHGELYPVKFRDNNFNSASYKEKGKSFSNKKTCF